MLCMLPSPFVINCIVWVLYTVTEFLQNERMYEDSYFSNLEITPSSSKMPNEVQQRLSSCQAVKDPADTASSLKFFSRPDRQTIIKNSQKLYASRTQVCMYTYSCMHAYTPIHTHTYHTPILFKSSTSFLLVAEARTADSSSWQRLPSGSLASSTSSITSAASTTCSQFFFQSQKYNLF